MSVEFVLYRVSGHNSHHLPIEEKLAFEGLAGRELSLGSTFVLVLPSLVGWFLSCLCATASLVEFCDGVHLTPVLGMAISIFLCPLSCPLTLEPHT